MSSRPYEKSRHLPAVQRIWKEAGWVSTDEEAAAIEHFFDAGEALVTEIDGQAEASVHGVDGRMKYQHEDLDLWVVSAVTVSRIARKRRLAQTMTAELLAIGALRGAEVAALGMFEQGFYEKLGFGTCSYEHWVTFDPTTLLVNRPYRRPKRLTVDDWEAMHRALARRERGHGGVVVNSSSIYRAECLWVKKPFGLGYYDAAGDLSHFFWAADDGEHGPYNVQFLCYSNQEQFFDLLMVMKSLGDQVTTISLLEPNEIQFQDLLRHPIRNRRHRGAGSKHQNDSQALAIWQARILDLKSCIAKTHLPGPDVDFNLRLHDPATERLPADCPWRGVGGDFRIRLGQNSRSSTGHARKLPTLEASVGAFTRLWLGCQTATGLAATDDLDGPPDLLRDLDWTVRLPRTQQGWAF